MTAVPNSTFRACDFPTCGRQFDIAAVFTGAPGHERGWLQHKQLSMHMCPDHTWVWGDGEPGSHRPTVDHRPGGSVVECSCKTVLSGRTLGDLKRGYLDHLAAESAYAAGAAR